VLFSFSLFIFSEYRNTDTYKLVPSFPYSLFILNEQCHNFRLYWWCATHHTQLIFLDLVILIKFGKAHKLWNLSLCNYPHSPVPSSLLGPNVLCNLFSNSLNLLSSLNVKLSFTTIHNSGSTVLCYLIFMFVDRRQTQDS
jgi:hypothetical protein